MAKECELALAMRLDLILELKLELVLDNKIGSDFNDWLLTKELDLHVINNGLYCWKSKYVIEFIKVEVELALILLELRLVVILVQKLSNEIINIYVQIVDCERRVIFKIRIN